MAISLVPLIGGFIGFIIIIAIGAIILGGSVTDCRTIPGYNSTVPSNGEIRNGTRSGQSIHSSTIGHNEGWAEACLDTNDQSGAGYALLAIGVIVFAAVIILSIVRLLG